MSTLTNTTPVDQYAGATADVEPAALVGLLAEYRDVDAIFKAARGVRAAGFTRWDVCSPFPIHGIDAAIGIRPTILPWLVAGGGVTGCAAGLALQCFCNSIDYALLISGKPFFSIPAFIPVVFECTVLFAALTAVFGMLGLNRLPMLYNPLFKSDRFRRVTSDRFFVVIDASDPTFEEAETLKLLESLGSIVVERVED